MPRKVTVTLSDGRQITFGNVPDNVTPDQVEQRAAKEFPGAKVALIEGDRKTPSRAEAFQTGIDQAKLNAFHAFMKGARAIGIAGPETATERRQRENFERDYGARMKETAAQRPWWSGAGKLAGESLITAPVTAGVGGLVGKLGTVAVKAAPRAGAAAKVVKAAGRALEATGKATASGGIGVRQVEKEAVRRGAAVGATRLGRTSARVAGGAISGATGAALTDQDITSGAIFGGGLPVAGVIAKHGAGWTFDFLTRRIGKVRAAEVMRNLVAEKGTEIAEALKNAPRNVAANTAEFLAQKGLLTPELAAATRIVGGSTAGKPLERVAQARAAGQKETRAFIRGGETQTEAMGDVAAQREAVRTETEPQRQAFMERVDIGRTQIAPAEQQAEAYRNAAANEVATARRLLAASERRGGLAETQAAVTPGEPAFLGPQGQMPRLTEGATSIENVQRLRGEAGGLERFGGEAADRSLQAGRDARSAEEIAANLRAQGLEPLDISNVTGRLRQIAADALPGTARRQIFNKFADMLDQRAAEKGGIIDATGLHLARREMGEFVAGLLGGGDPSAIQRGTAQLIGEAQPLIDAAFKKAGGEGWGEYLDAFSQGMRKVERSDFERKLADLPEARYTKVMAGQDPEFVAEHFGPGRFDINVELMGPKLPAAHQLAGEIGATRAVAQTGYEDLTPSQRLSMPTGARARATEFMEPAMGNRLFARSAQIAGGIPGVYGVGQLASQLEQEAANRLRTRVARQLAPALAQPVAAANLLPVRSATDYLSSASNLLTPMGKNILAQIATNYTNAPGGAFAYPAQEAYSDAPEGQVLLGYDTGPSGERYPVYGYPRTAP